MQGSDLKEGDVEKGSTSNALQRAIIFPCFPICRGKKKKFSLAKKLSRKKIVSLNKIFCSKKIMTCRGGLQRAISFPCKQICPAEKNCLAKKKRLQKNILKQHYLWCKQANFSHEKSPQKSRYNNVLYAKKPCDQTSYRYMKTHLEAATHSISSQRGGKA